MLVRGPTGSGKTMLAGLFARAGALRGERVMYYGFEEPRPDVDLATSMRSVWASATSARGGDFKLQCRYPEATSLEDLLVDLRLGSKEFQPSLVVMDSISSIEHASSEKGFRQFMIGVRVDSARPRAKRAAHADGSGGHRSPNIPLRISRPSPMRSFRSDYSPAGYELESHHARVKMRGSAHETHPYRLQNRCWRIEH
jgi:circadian clock protein KaiC